MPQVPCPRCQRSTDYSPDNPWRPFCSQRCKLIDLGDWAQEKHSIAVPIGEEPDSSGSPPAT